MTVAEVASILKLNQQTVRNWITEGRLPALHVGRRVRVRRADFDALIEGSAIGGDAQPTPPSIWDGEIPLPQVPISYAEEPRAGQE
jgi:excisionase family DNA binding protein